MHRQPVLSLLVLALALTACAGARTPFPLGGDVEAGRMLFHKDTFPTCSSCYWETPGVALIGPLLRTIGAEAGSRAPGQSTESYLRESIVPPDAYLALGSAANIMATSYEAQRSEQELADLVAYLLTLREELDPHRHWLALRR